MAHIYSYEGVDPFNCPQCGAHDYGLWAPQIGDCRWCMAKDAERYRKIMNRFSPFIVRDVRRHDVHTYFISPELTKALDEWDLEKEGERVVSISATNGSQAK